MQIRYHCPSGNCVALIEYEPLEDAPPTIHCPRCRFEHPLYVTDHLRRENVVDTCAICGNTELFLRKDFPQRLGLFIVLLAGGASVFYFRTNFLLAYGILTAAVLIDLMIWLMIGRVTTCYACRAEYRKGRLNPAHEAFELARSEKY